jgi:hypothetical protein
MLLLVKSPGSEWEAVSFPQWLFLQTDSMILPHLYEGWEFMESWPEPEDSGEDDD